MWSPEALEGIPDPVTDDGWAYWREHGWPEERRDMAIRRFAHDSLYRQDAAFIAAHWVPLDDDTCVCNAFDPETRLCTAHEDRPPVCRDFPWYGAEPESWRSGDLMLQCSYLLDLPPDQRPEGARPLIPLTVIR